MELNSNIYKTALNYAKERYNSDVIALLMKGPKEAENDEKIKNQPLRQKDGSLQDESKSLKENIASVTKKNELLQKENQLLKKDIAYINKKYESLQEENQLLKKDIAYINKKYELLQEENQLLKKDIASVYKKNESLQKENQKIKNENGSPKKENQELEENAKMYENYLLSLKEKDHELTFFDFDDYEDESVIFEGKTSKVKIVHKKEQEKYAMKELVLFDYKSFKRFLRESEILFKLRHPCIIRVYGFNLGDEIHKPSIILSLEPKSLETSINNKELNEFEKNRITVELVLGMRYIHRHFIHRDLKPTNIFLSKKKHVRISDFGFAKEEDLETSRSKGVGTLRFMAPELFDEDGDENDTKFTNKVDVYSFGIILIFIVTESYPSFSFKKLMKGIIPKLPENISSWVQELIARCLSPTPENRPSFDEIFDIMKINNFDMFNDSKNQKQTISQRKMKKIIEKRVMKIEAFEFQHQQV